MVLLKPGAYKIDSIQLKTDKKEATSVSEVSFKVYPSNISYIGTFRPIFRDGIMSFSYKYIRKVHLEYFNQATQKRISSLADPQLLRNTFYSIFHNHDLCDKDTLVYTY